MKINIIGHHLDITDGLKDHIGKKLKKIEGHSQDILEIKIILSVENITHNAEGNIYLHKTDLYAKCSSSDMYQSIDLLLNKLDKQIIKHNDKIKRHPSNNNIKRTDFSAEN
jgi:putative sigma-54 modulation protein